MDAVAADGGNHGDAGADDADDDGDDDCCSSTCQLDIDILIIRCEPCFKLVQHFRRKNFCHAKHD